MSWPLRTLTLSSTHADPPSSLLRALEQLLHSASLLLHGDPRIALGHPLRCMPHHGALHDAIDTRRDQQVRRKTWGRTRNGSSMA